MGDDDVLAWQKLIDKHGDVIYNYAYRLTNNEADAEDLYQEVLIKTFKNFNQFKSGTNFEAWATIITRNTYINIHHRSKAGKMEAYRISIDPAEYFDDEKEKNLASHSSVDLKHTEEDFISNITDPRILEEFAKLPQLQREIFVLLSIDGHLYKEAAEILGIPLGTVMSSQYRTKKILREALKEFDFNSNLLEENYEPAI